jgi:aryl-alcohol dehydrogenase-like predicted oxidoreductase
VSVIGFGAWGIGGPAMAGNVPIGWGDVDDDTSRKALRTAYDRGITFYDTADVYGFGHSEELIGEVFGARRDVVIATKVGSRKGEDGNLTADYSLDYMLAACEASLRRLRREAIDYYQLHIAKLAHLERGECLEAMQRLHEQGKIRYWGISLNTFAPQPEAEFLLSRNLGHGFQLVLNIINQRALPVVRRAAERGYGIIARMPLQFGLLTGKFSRETVFTENDHRSFRLTREVLEKSLDALESVWRMAEQYGVSKTTFALSYPASFPEISTIIPGIKTPEQAIANTEPLVQLSSADLAALGRLYEERLSSVVEVMERYR